MNKHKEYLFALGLVLFIWPVSANVDQYMVVYNVPFVLSITSFYPSSDPTTLQGTVQTFNITMSKTANAIWFINGYQVKNDTNTMLTSYTNSTAGVGTWNVSVISADGSDIVSKTWNWTVNAQQQDITPPISNISLSGILINDSYISDVTVTLTVTDDISGINYTKYRINNISWNNYTVPFLVSTRGTNTVNYYSVDDANNIEQTKSITIKIDSVNLLTNPGFELSTKTPGIPDNWSKYPSIWNSGARLTYPEIGNDGSNAIGISQSNTGYKQLLIQPVQNIVAGINYTVSGYINTTNASVGSTLIGIDWFTSSGIYIRSNIIYAGGNNPWTNKIAIVKAPSNAAKANFYVGLSGTGKALFDNVWLISS